MNSLSMSVRPAPLWTSARTATLPGSLPATMFNVRAAPGTCAGALASCTPPGADVRLHAARATVNVTTSSALMSPPHEQGRGGQNR